MKLVCASCLLHLTSEHFLKGQKCFSICDLCRMRKLEPNDYYNYRNQVYSEVLKFIYVGSSQISSVKTIELTVKQRKFIEKIFLDYDDASLVVKKKISRRSLNSRLLAFENREIKIDDVGRFFDNLLQLGFDVSKLHDLQKVDSTSRMLIYQRYRNICQYCGRKGYSIDHREPVSRGGSNDLDNLTLSCQECNKLKGDMPYEWFIEFNLQMKIINHKLVTYEKEVDYLIKLKEDNTRKLNAYTHLKGVTVDDRSTIYRNQIKEQQILLDGIKRDYQSLRNLRKNYIKTRYQMYKLEKKDS